MTSHLLDVLRARRTIRRYTGEPVSDADIDVLLEAAMYAPSRLDRRPWRFVVLRDRALQDEMGDAIGVRNYLAQAPAVIVICADSASSPTWMMDIAAATENLLLAATDLGLGAAWVGWPESGWWQPLEDLLRRKIGVPADIRVATLVAVGHPAERRDPYSREDRFDPTLIHDGRWGNKRLP